MSSAFLSWDLEVDEHFPACQDQPNDKDCICDDIEQGLRDEEANNGEIEFEGR